MILKKRNKYLTQINLGDEKITLFDCLIQRLRVFFLTMKQTVLRAPKDPSRLSPYNMRRGSRSPTGFPDSSWGGEGQGSNAGVVTHINCLDFLFFFSLSLLFFPLSLLLLLFDAPNRTIFFWSGYGVTFPLYFFFISTCFTEMAYPLRCFLFWLLKTTD
jgi:hypothetical protein